MSFNRNMTRRQFVIGTGIGMVSLSSCARHGSTDTENTEPTSEQLETLLTNLSGTTWYGVHDSGYARFNNYTEFTFGNHTYTSCDRYFIGDYSGDIEEDYYSAIDDVVSLERTYDGKTRTTSYELFQLDGVTCLRRFKDTMGEGKPNYLFSSYEDAKKYADAHIVEEMEPIFGTYIFRDSYNEEEILRFELSPEAYSISVVHDKPVAFSAYEDLPEWPYSRNVIKLYGYSSDLFDKTWQISSIDYLYGGAGNDVHFAITYEAGVTQTYIYSSQQPASLSSVSATYEAGYVEEIILERLEDVPMSSDPIVTGCELRDLKDYLEHEYPDVRLDTAGFDIDAIDFSSVFECECATMQVDADTGDFMGGQIILPTLEEATKYPPVFGGEKEVV